MYKHASKNIQFRERNAALTSRVNTAGIDEATFSRHEVTDLRAQLMVKKKEIEIALRNMKTQMARAQISRVSNATWQRWCAERANLISEAQALDLKLTELRAVHLQQRLDNDETFETAFVQVSREMLAEEVFNRLCQAAILRAKPK